MRFKVRSLVAVEASDAKGIASVRDNASKVAKRSGPTSRQCAERAAAYKGSAGRPIAALPRAGDTG